jgi:hypothetical protein
MSQKNDLFTQDSYTVHRKKSLQRTASKTVRKFTGFFSADALPQAVSVSLDWLSMQCECLLPEPAENQGPVWLTDNVVLEYLQRGTPVYKHSYTVYLDGESVANVHTHGRNDKIIKPGTAKLEILNHVFQSSTLHDVIDQVQTACKMPVVKNYSEIHIALDGANHVHEFLNNYIRQKKNPKIAPDLMSLGSWSQQNRVRMKGKANVDCKRFNRATGDFDNFKVGTGKKYLTVYNKTSELLKSHKSYIKDMWDRAGLDTANGRTIWRCELRMKSGAIKEIKDFDIKKVNDPNYLLQIFRTQLENFFHFVLIEGDGNVTRARNIDLFQFFKLKVPMLDKIPRAIVRGAYKAQMAIHNAYANVRLKMLKTYDQVNAALQHITDNVQLYNLDDWYQRKKLDWDCKYLVHAYAPEDYREQLK